ncbi:MAG: prolyl oligopeptidase family serine peptidase [Gemmataceae bacterium]
MIRRLPLPAVLFLILASAVTAQDRVTGANYPLAQKFTREFVAQHVQEASVLPQWVGKTDVFWYAARTPTGTRYWKVDPAKKERAPLFDHVALAAALSEASKKPLDGDTLRLDRPVVSADGKTLSFVFGEFRYEYALADGKLKQTGKATAAGPMAPEQIERMRQQFGDERVNEILRRMQEQQQQERRDDQQQQDQQQQQGGAAPAPKDGPPAAGYKNYSPDKKRYVFAQKHNLFLGEEGQPEDKATQISTDGVEDYSFAAGFGGFGGGRGGNAQRATPAAADRKTRPNVTWSPDSKAFFVQRTDSRGVKDLFLVDSIAAPRPTLEQYKYPMPGEDAVRKTELYYCDVAKKALAKITPKWKDERYTDVRWGKPSGELRFIRRDRLQRNLEVCAFDVFKGACNCLFGEGFEAAFLDFQPARYLDETDDLLWWSERSGWGHFYRYGRDGKLKNALTSGAWRASRVVDVDAKAGVVYLAGNAREAGENPYYQHLYRVKLDGTGLTCLDPSVLPNGKPYAGGFNQSSSLSPSKKFVVTTSTRVDHAPFATVRDETGNVVMTLEETDLSRLQATGWKMPETFTVKAADGVTDLYGNLWKPFDFDPAKKYPVIANVYPGPQTEGVTYRFGAYSPTMQMAQLGFIVIQVGHRGGSPERSKAYHSFGYFNLRDYGLVDKKAALEALAARFPYIDLDRVGIYGHSGGGFMSAAAVLQPPYNDFFKAAVASAGNHDNNIYNDNWSERYHGMKEVPADQKTTSATTTTTGTERGLGFGTGTGRKKKGPEEAIELELADLLEMFNPDDKESVADLEKRIAEVKAKLEALKKAETKVEAKGEAKEEKKEEKKAEVAPPPKMKWDIKVPTNAELAGNLKGHLLLVHGEIDNNVHPANTMRLADALIKANKRFDLLIIPGARHGFGAAQPYFTQKMWDFFAEHLLSDRQTGADINTKAVKRR